MTQKSHLLGIGINKLKKDELIFILKHRIKENKRTKIFTPNTEIMLRAKKDPHLKAVLLSADILIADGAGVVMASKLLKDPLPERLAGIEIAENLLSLASIEGWSVFLLGGDTGIAEAAKKNLEKKFSGIEICGVHHGYFDVRGEENKKVLKKINKVSPDILFVCMGFPRQELWICENCTKLKSVKVAMGLGGSLDVWANKAKRAPKILQTLCLEWLWRIMCEPKRIAFLAKIPIFFREIWKQKRSKH